MNAGSLGDDNFPDLRRKPTVDDRSESLGMSSVFTQNRLRGTVDGRSLKQFHRENLDLEVDFSALKDLDANIKIGNDIEKFDISKEIESLCSDSKK